MANVRIYAELTKSQYFKIQNGEYALEMPYGTTMYNRKGSKGLFFECSSEQSVSELMAGLKTSGINAQIDQASKKKQDKENEKKNK